MSKFNAEEYWGSRIYKVWVVTMKKRRGKTIIDSENRYVRAKTKESAIRTGRYYSAMKSITDVSCRLATPTDLGCVPDNSNNAKRVA